MRHLAARLAVVAATLAAVPVGVFADMTILTPPETISQSIGGVSGGPGSFYSPAYSLPSLAPALVQDPVTPVPLNGSINLGVNQTLDNPNFVGLTQSNVFYSTDASPGGFQFVTQASSQPEVTYLLGGTQASPETGSADIKVTSQISKTVKYTTDAVQSFEIVGSFYSAIESDAGSPDAVVVGGQSVRMTIDVYFLGSLLPAAHADSSLGDTGLGLGPIWVPAGTTIEIDTSIVAVGAMTVAASGPEADLDIFRDATGTIVVTGYVPEPATLGLLAPALVPLVLRRRRCGVRG